MSLYYRMIAMVMVGAIGLPLSLFHIKLLLEGIIHISMLAHLILLPIGITLFIMNFISIVKGRITNNGTGK